MLKWHVCITRFSKIGKIRLFFSMLLQRTGSLKKIVHGRWREKEWADDGIGSTPCLPRSFRNPTLPSNFDKLGAATRCCDTNRNKYLRVSLTPVRDYTRLSARARSAHANSCPSNIESSVDRISSWICDRDQSFTKIGLAILFYLLFRINVFVW